VVGSNEKKIKDDEQSLYEDYWNGKWKCNLVDLEQWLNVLVILFLFLIRKNTTEKIKFLLLLIVLHQLKSILMLPMHQVIYEGC
jgi:hypothetical protein